MYWQNRKDRVSEYILCERAIFGVFNSFTVKKVNIFTINVKFKVILSSNSGGDVCTGHPPHPKKWGDTSPPPPSPPPPRIYASAIYLYIYLSIYLSDLFIFIYLSIYLSIDPNQCCHGPQPTSSGIGEESETDRAKHTGRTDRQTDRQSLTLELEKKKERGPKRELTLIQLIIFC